MLQVIKAFALLGGEWVLYLLLVLSIWAVAVMWDRYFYFKKRNQDVNALEEKIPNLLTQGKVKEAEQVVKNSSAPQARILEAGLSNLSAGAEALAEILESQKLKEKLEMEKNLLVLGTLGNNAPFVGLFGTVLGIIKAFNDLALAGTSGPTIVMRGVSEALVATAVGLLIAIPCVAAYNYFQNQVKRSLTMADRFSGLLLAHVKKEKG